MTDWTLLRAFHAVAETGSLSGAAKRLRVSQPTIGRQIAALEREFNSRLFVRHSRGLELTAAGASIRAAAAQMEEAATAIDRRVTGLDMTPAGSVRLSTTEGLGIHWLPPHLAAFRDRHPNIAVELVVDNFAVNLARRDADIALRLIRPQQPDLIGRKVARLRLGLYAARSYLARRRPPAQADELRQHDLVGFEGNLAAIGQAVWFGAAIGDARVAFRSNSLLAQFEAVRAGIGIGVLSSYMAEPDPALARVLPGLAPPDIDIWLVVHSDLKRNPRIRLLYDFLADRIRDHRGELAGAG